MKKKLKPLPVAWLGLCARLKIDPKRLREPKIHAAFIAHFAEARRIFMEPDPISTPLADLKAIARDSGGSAVACARVGNRTRKG